MPIEALANRDVSSVTKSAARLPDALASIYVITHDDIVRAGTVTLPGILRLAPNLQVLRSSASGTTITARGLSGNPHAQNRSEEQTSELQSLLRTSYAVLGFETKTHRPSPRHLLKSAQ